MQIMLDDCGLPPAGFNLGEPCHEWGGEFPVRLFKDRRLPVYQYAVQYGRQLDRCLSYSEAAAKLGEALMHRLACQGALD